MNEEIKPEEIKKKTKEEAVIFIDQIMQECAMMGANDRELPTLNSLKEQVQTGQISPEEACTEAQSIRSSKQDYH